MAPFITETQDFNATSARVVFRPDLDMFIRCTVVPVVNDLVLEEESEVFTVQLSTTETNTVVLGFDSTSVTIIDDDCKLICMQSNCEI